MAAQTPSEDPDPNFRKVQRSRVIRRGDRAPWHFPTRSDYVRHLIAHGDIEEEQDLFEKPELVLAVQTDWHERGQNGCRFAQFLAKSPLEYEWHVVVVRPGPSPVWSRSVARQLDKRVYKAIRDRTARALSLIFPDVIDAWSFARLIGGLGDLPRWSVEVLDVSDLRLSLTAIGLRRTLNREGVQAEVLGFGPLSFLPRTRQAPFAELALAVKPKGERIRPGLSRDRSRAHLADVPLPFTDEDFRRLRWMTSENRRIVLQGSYDSVAKARVTVVLPTEVWEDAQEHSR